MSSRCPGLDTRYWRPEDIFDVTCPSCGADVEFFKDDSVRDCRCGARLHNPRLDKGCAGHCEHGKQCAALWGDEE